MDLLLDINDINQEIFDSITLQTPSPLQGGTYLAKLTINDNPILFQTPKSKTKKGIVTNNKRNYCDLLFENNCGEFHNWIDEFETTIKNKIYEKGDIWFNDKPTLDDIDYNWNTSLKIFKKHSILRTFLGKSKDINDILSVYDSDQNKVNANEINSESTIISIIEVTGLKFSSSSFHLEYCVRQIMIVKEAQLFNKCMIKLKSDNNVSNQNVNNTNESHTKNNDESANNDIDVDSKKDDTVIINEVDDEGNLDNEDNDGNEGNLDNDSLEQNTQKEPLVNNLENSIELEDDTINDNDEEQSNLNDILMNNSENNNKESKQLKKNIDNNQSENIDSKEKNEDYLEKTYDLNDLSELDIEIPENSDIVNLKNPNEVYLELYRKAKQKARETKLQAIQAYLELNNIKKTYMIEETESSDDEELNELMIQ